MDEAIRRTRRGITVKLEMTQKQELKLTPQMLQSMEILQMSTQELEAYLQELVQENPAAAPSVPTPRASCGPGHPKSVRDQRSSTARCSRRQRHSPSRTCTVWYR